LGVAGPIGFVSRFALRQGMLGRVADVTQILSAIEQGDPTAAAELLPLVYDELRKLAAARLAEEKPGQTLQATALVHEAYVRLVGGRQTDGWNGRGHFFAAAAEAMRRILVENARRKLRIKHGGASEQVELEVADLPTTVPDDDLLALDEALAQLKHEDPDKARLIELRFFGGLSNEQAAEVLGISTATAKRHWRYARAWLHRVLRPDDEAPRS
jgi:RNA polymerase sigma factor (TIGR02999 family)